MKLGLNDINEFQLTALLESVAPVFTGQAGKRMKLMRMEKKLDQAQLAKLLGVGPKTICGAENGTQTQRNPILLTKLLAVFDVRRAVFILTGKYSSEFEASAKKIHSEYWDTKHGPQGYRLPHAHRPHLRIAASKHDLILEVNRLRDELQQTQGKNSDKKGED